MAENIKKLLGVSPQLRDYLDVHDQAMAGDIIMVIDPTTSTPAPTAAAWSHNIKISLETTEGKVHTWLNKAYATTASIADTSSAGTASITSTTLTIVDGQAVIAVAGDTAAWLNAETATLTIANITVLGVTVTGGTYVATFTTP